MADKKSTGKTIFERALAKLPKEKQDAYKALLEEPEVLDVVGEHALLREDYSRLADEATKTKNEFEDLHTKNIEWRAEKLSKLTEGEKATTILEKMKAAGIDPNALLGGKGDGGEGGKPATPPVVGGLTEDQLKKALLNTEQQGMAVMTTLTDIGMAHLHEFKEPLKSAEIVAKAQKEGLTLQGAYDALVAPRRKERQEAEITERIAKARKEGAEEAATKFQATPYPVGSDSDGAPTTLSGLTKDSTKKNEFGVDAAVRAFNQSRQRAAS